MSDDLIAFVTARLDEDEAAAKAAQIRFPGPWDSADNTDSPLPGAVTMYDSRDESVGVIRGSYAAVHIARHDPARTLADVAADRALLAMYEAQDGYELPDGVRDGRDPDERMRDEAVMEALERAVEIRAARFSGHPDYRSEWAP